MRRLILIIAIVTLACQAMASEVLIIPQYDGSLTWEASTDRLLRQIVDDLRALLKPVEGKITSRYGNRLHPVLGITRHHDGIDIGCGVGTPIKAVLAGTIRMAGWGGGYGRMIEVSHKSNDMISRYAHLSKITVKPGQRVARGQIIGYSGNTGLSTGPHLHFELFQHGQVVDPSKMLGKQIAHIPRL